MARLPRAAKGGLFYHVLNRANARLPMFEEEDDYLIFDRTLAEALERVRMRLLAFCLMPDHWHLVVWPRRDGELSDFTRWLTMTHTQRWHAHRGTAGQGHLYQGRYKSFPIQSGEPLVEVCRFVERNPVRSGLVDRAQDWPWSSLGRQPRGDGALEIELA
jgi:putative transposase